jgi:hypothetical protein
VSAETTAIHPWTLSGMRFSGARIRTTFRTFYTLGLFSMTNSTGAPKRVAPKPPCW